MDLAFSGGPTYATLFAALNVASGEVIIQCKTRLSGIALR